MSAADFLALKAAAVRSRTRADAAALEALRRAALATATPASFRAALSAGERVAVIAEFKRRSPGAGVLTDESPSEVIAGYAAAGARAASVLTDADDFGGSLDDLRAAAAPSLPSLRKDFIVDEARILEARAAGASAVLLIVAILDDRELRALLDACDAMSLDALVEVHDEAELRRALDAGARLVGVNNRDLRTLRTDLTVTERLAPRLPADAILVSESGIRTRADVERVRAAGAAAVLVGEALLLQSGPARAALLGELTSVPRKRVRDRPSFRLKVCGLTTPADAALAASLGADALGVVLWPLSPRAVDPAAAAAILAAAPAGVVRVGVFVDPVLGEVTHAVEACALDFVQLSGEEAPSFARAVAARTGARIIRTVHVDGSASIDRFADYPADLFLLDAPRRAGAGGTGERFDWRDAARLPWPRERVIVAGGLRVENVAAALETLRPAAIDVCSGVELSPGRKDPVALRRFIETVRRHDHPAMSYAAVPRLEART
ncbi:MAG TPA: hypothetical protein VMN78_12925 [Longimicrobiales bacterium]|nr:hypothetical protein [Longimicrobiales bacterium]